MKYFNSTSEKQNTKIKQTNKHKQTTIQAIARSIAAT
jgi:hypothetical protein